MSAREDPRPHWRGLRYGSTTLEAPEQPKERPGWRVTFDRGTAFLSGPTKSAVRRRIAVAGDHHPPWVERRDAWATSPATANEVIGQLDRHKVPVVIDDVDQGALDLTSTQPANRSDRQAELW